MPRLTASKCTKRQTTSLQPTTQLQTTATINNNRIKCQFCSSTFINSKTLSTHINKFHSSNSSLSPSPFNHSQQINKKIGNFESSIRSYTTQNNNIKIALLNINSLLNKYHSLSFMLDQQLVDVLVINETKLNSLIDDSNFISPFYHMYRRDRDSNSCGGGVLVYIKKSLRHNLVLVEDEAEMIIFRLELRPNYKVNLIACYRPPHSDNEDRFFAVLDKHLLESEETTKDTIIIGDLNYDLGRSSTFEESRSRLHEFMNIHGLNNMISKGTRFNPHTNYASLLDVVLCYNANLCTSSEVFPCSFSDHSLVISTLDSTNSTRHNLLKSFRCLNKNNLDLIKNSILTIFSTFIILGLDINEQWLHVKNILISIII